MAKTEFGRVWTVAEAKARLSEIMRLADSEGPQFIGTRKPYVIIPAEDWNRLQTPRPHLGRWLVDNVTRGMNWEIPRDRQSYRPVPYAAEAEEGRT